MNRESVVSYLKGIQDLYPDGIPIKSSAAPGIFLVSDGALADESKRMLLENIASKGMKRKLGDEIEVIEEKNWSLKAASFIVVFGEFPLPPLKMGSGSEARVGSSPAIRTFTLEEIGSDDAKKRLFWGQLKSLLSSLEV